MQNNDDLIVKIKNAFSDVSDALEKIANKPAEMPQILNNAISGDKVHGGTITKFGSTGITDESTKKNVTINDLGLHVDAVHTPDLKGDVRVGGHLNVLGEITAKKLHVNEITSDVRQERSSPLEFIPDSSGDVYGKGIFWKDKSSTKQLIYRANPDRFWASLPLDLARDTSYNINNKTVLTENELGTSVRKSSLTEVGTLKNLRTVGNLNIDEYIFYSSDSERLGFGTDSPNGDIAIASLDGELILDISDKARIGNYTTTDLEIITDNTARIKIGASGHITIGSNVETKVSVQGKIGVNINNPDCDIVTAGPVKFQGKRQEIGDSIPKNGTYRKGDIVWNTDPKPTGYVGWICVREGTPGEWKPFGTISA